MPPTAPTAPLSVLPVPGEIVLVPFGRGGAQYARILTTRPSEGAALVQKYRDASGRWTLPVSVPLKQIRRDDPGSGRWVNRRCKVMASLRQPLAVHIVTGDLFKLRPDAGGMTVYAMATAHGGGHRTTVSVRRWYGFGWQVPERISGDLLAERIRWMNCPKMRACRSWSMG
jgi:hypothetical protein